MVAGKGKVTKAALTKNISEKKRVVRKKVAQSAESAQKLKRKWDGLERSNKFCQKTRPWLFTTTILASLASIVATGFLAFQLVTRPTSPFIAMTDDGKQTALWSMRRPNLSPQVISNWVTQAVIAAYSIDFFHYRTQLGDASRYFTPEGWEKFLEALALRDTIENIVKDKLTVSAVVTGKPVLLSAGYLGGKPAWRYQFPLLLTYQGYAKVVPQKAYVTALIVPVETRHYIQGIGIQQLDVN